MFGIDPSLYYPLHLYTILIFTLIVYHKLSSIQGYNVLKVQDGMRWMPLFLFVLIVFVGFRPLSYLFGDTLNYALIYEKAKNGDFINEGDWLFNMLIILFSKFTTVEWFFLTIMIGYVVPMYLACKRLQPKSANLLMLFCLGAFSFYTYGTNGIRNGMACSFFILALTYIICEKPKILTFCVLSFVAISIHKSVALPFLAALFASYYNKPKMMFYFWIVSIGVSLVAGGAVSSFMGAIGFDDRIQGYIGQQGILEEGAVFSHTGFRWDFLLYSSMPILLGWYVIMKRGIVNRSYYILLATYIYSNAFWVMVIRAPFSNRFAYLSWFLYPIVLAYPLLHLPVFKIHHSKKTAMILLAHFGFTFIMWLIGK